MSSQDNEAVLVSGIGRRPVCVGGHAARASGGGGGEGSGAVEVGLAKRDCGGGTIGTGDITDPLSRPAVTGIVSVGLVVFVGGEVGF